MSYKKLPPRHQAGVALRRLLLPVFLVFALLNPVRAWAQSLPPLLTSSVTVSSDQTNTDLTGNSATHCVPVGTAATVLGNSVNVVSDETDTDFTDNAGANCISSAAAAAPDLTTAIGQPAPSLAVGAASNVPITVTNSGTLPTTGTITATLTLPTGTSAPASFTNNGWSCTTTGQTVSCSNPGPIANGSSSTVQVPITPNASTVGTTPGPFTGSSGTPGESDPNNNAANPMTPTTPVASGPAPDLTTTIGQPAPALAVNAASNVPITVTNSGSGPTTGPITTTLTLPTGTSAPASFTNNGWSCTTSGQIVSCSNPGPIAAGSGSTVQVPVTPNASTAGTTPGPFTGSSGTPGESNPANNAAAPMTPTTPVASGPAPDLTTVIGQPAPSLSVNAASIVPITVTNSGSGPTTGPITATLTLPTGTSAPASFSTNGWVCTTSSQVVNCTNPGPIAAGSGSTAQVPVTPNASTVGTTPGPFTGSSGTAGESNPANNAAALMTPSTPVAAPSDTTPPATPIINAPAANSTTNDNTPLFSGTAEPNSTVRVMKGSTQLCSTTADASGNWQCASSVVLPDGSNTVTATATDAANNVSPPASTAFTVAAMPDLITSIGPPAPVLMSSRPSTVPVTLSNVGGGPTSGPITATVSLPAGTSAPASFSSNGWACTATVPPDAFTPSTVTCTSSTPIGVNGASTINVPVTPDPARVGTTVTLNATAAGGGEANNSNNTATPLVAGPVLPASRILPIKLLLHGPYDSASGVMNDGLRSRGLLPANEPYTGLGFARAGVGGESVATGVFSITGNAAVVDWVLVELRDANNSGLVIITRAALLLRNGSVKDVDGVSDLAFTGLTQGNYFVAVQHRNHLGVMTVSPVTLSANTPLQDFTTMTTAQVNGVNARRAVGNLFTLWAGNANGDSKVQAAGASNDLAAITSLVLNPNYGNQTLVRNWKVPGYRTADVNMDGDTLASGPNNDIAVVVNNVNNNPINTGFNRNITVDQRMP